MRFQISQFQSSQGAESACQLAGLNLCSWKGEGNGGGVRPFSLSSSVLQTGRGEKHQQGLDAMGSRT